MSPRFFKHNPALLTPQELVAQFVVRQKEFALILQRLRENTTDANQHLLVVGHRGSGKTMLVHRVAQELLLERDGELAKHWHPIAFAEESYGVMTAGEFWLEALRRVAAQTRNPRWSAVVKELLPERDEQRLCERALTKLLQFAEERGRRLLLVVENLNMLFDEQLTDDQAWALRKTLLNEPRIMVLGTATARFKAIARSGAAFFELFDLIELAPLGADECRTLWSSLTSELLDANRVRPLQILTGGNIRLIAVLALFAAKRSLAACLNEFERLMDDHTDYFKSNVEALPPGERKVFVTAASLWREATAREIAERARLDVSKASAILESLVRKGAIAVPSASPRRKTYEVVERMYNIYHLVRQEGDLRGRVLALVRFMRDFYDTSLLCNVAKSIALEALELPADERVGHFLAIDALLENWSSETAVPTLLESIPYAFVRQADALPSLQERVRFMRGQTADADVAPAQALTQAEADMRKEIGEVGAAPPPGQGTPQVSLPRGQVYGEASRSAEGDKTHLEALLQRVKDSLAGHRFDEAVQLCREAVQIAPGLGWAWALLGAVSHHELHQLAEAEQAYRKAIECRPEVAAGWASLGQLLHEELQQYHEAEQAYRKALELDARLAWVWGNLGLMLHQNLHRFEEAEQAFRKALELDPQLAAAWGYLGALLQQQPQRLAEAEQAYRKALELDPKFAAVRPSLSGLLLARGQEEEALREAERCLHDTLRSPEVLNGLAWCWRIHGKPQHLRQALLWAIDAERGQPDTSEIVHTLSCILGDLGKWKDALQRAPRFLRDRRMVGQSTVVVVAFFVAAAAAGHAEEGIRSLHGSPAADLLEPLEVALRLHAGEKVMVPREVREVAKDIVAQIEARRAARQGASPPSGGTPGPIS